VEEWKEGLLAETQWIDQRQSVELQAGEKNADDENSSPCGPTESHDEDLKEVPSPSKKAKGRRGRLRKSGRADGNGTPHVRSRKAWQSRCMRLLGLPNNTIAEAGAMASAAVTVMPIWPTRCFSDSMYAASLCASCGVHHKPRPAAVTGAAVPTAKSSATAERA
jgi:hypothetical protein